MDLVQLLHHNYSCFVLVRSKWRMEEHLFFNLCFQLSGLCWFSDYSHREKISSWRQRKVFLLREKSAKKGWKNQQNTHFFNLMASQRKYLIFPKTAIDKLFCAAVLVCLDSWLFVDCDVMQEEKLWNQSRSKFFPGFPTSQPTQILR